MEGLTCGTATVVSAVVVAPAPPRESSVLSTDKVAVAVARGGDTLERLACCTTAAVASAAAGSSASAVSPSPLPSKTSFAASAQEEEVERLTGGSPAVARAVVTVAS